MFRIRGLKKKLFFSLFLLTTLATFFLSKYTTLKSKDILENDKESENVA